MERNQTVEVLKALADDVRLDIVKKLAAEQEAMASCTLVANCACVQQLSQPAVSHHFSRLVDAGIVREEKRGTQKMYTLQRDSLERIGIDVTKL